MCNIFFVDSVNLKINHLIVQNLHEDLLNLEKAQSSFVLKALTFSSWQNFNFRIVLIDFI